MSSVLSSRDGAYLGFNEVEAAVPAPRDVIKAGIRLVIEEGDAYLAEDELGVTGHVPRNRVPPVEEAVVEQEPVPVEVFVEETPADSGAWINEDAWSQFLDDAMALGVSENELDDNLEEVGPKLEQFGANVFAVINDLGVMVNTSIEVLDPNGTFQTKQDIIDTLSIMGKVKIYDIASTQVSNPRRSYYR